MAKNKKELTPTEKYKKYRNARVGLHIAEYPTVIAAPTILAIVNRDKWFTTAEDGTKIGIGMALGLAVMGLAVYLVTSKKYKTSFITLVIGWCLMAFIFTLLSSIMTELANIMWFSFIGICVAFAEDEVATKMDKEATKIKEAMDQANKENLVDAYKEEIAEKKVKVKIKK